MRLTCVSLLLLATVVPASSQQKAGTTHSDKQTALSLPEAIPKIRPSVVQIRYLFTDLPRETVNTLDTAVVMGPFGTAFFIGNEGYVITARHVIEKFQQFPLRDPRTGRDLPYGRKVLRVEPSRRTTTRPVSGPTEDWS
jgi:S1-C subfamily serine protease